MSVGRFRFLLLTIVLLGAASPAMAHSRDGPFCPQPCAGWEYQLLYRVSDGKVLGVTGWDPASIVIDGVPMSNPGFVVHPGEAVLDVTSDSRLADLRQHLDDYYVETSSRQVRRRGTIGGGAPTPEAFSVEEIALLSLGGLLIAVNTALLRKRRLGLLWRRRPRV